MALVFDSLVINALSTQFPQTVTSNTTVNLSATDPISIIVLTSTSAKTVNLPSIAACPGKVFQIWNGAANSVTIYPDGTDKIGVGNLASVTLANSGDNVTLTAGTANGGGTGIARWIF